VRHVADPRPGRAAHNRAVPPSTLAQQTWDRATARAADGAELAVLQREAVEFAGPRIDAETTAAVPPRGRTFWLSVCKSLLWAVAVDVTLLMFESGHPLPGLTTLICVSAVVLAAGFGVIAGNHRVRQRRIRHGELRREGIRRLAARAARAVWAAQVPGRWDPAGPVPRQGTGRQWLARLGDDTGAVAAVDGWRLPGTGAPVACFLPDPQHFPDRIRDAADARGVPLFVVGQDVLYPMSAAASEVWEAYLSPATEQPPASLIGPPRTAAADQRTGNTR
jgi:hypothetical protein